MSTASAKRSLEPNVSLEFTEDEIEDSSNSEEPRKKGTKPGRKPLDGEAKSKRTAQNRAAQRAFRERKEKKMKDLEEKVRNLEEINQQNVLETEFLRGQLMTLVTELKKYRPENSNDSQVLEYLAKAEHDKPGESTQRRKDYNSEDVEENIRHKMSFTFAFPWKGEFNSSNNDSSDANDCRDNFLVQFPSPVSSSKSSLLSAKQRTALSPSVSGDGNHKSDRKNSNNSNGFTPGSNSAGWIDKFFYNNEEEELPPFYQSSNPGKMEDNNGYGDIMLSNQFDFNDKLDDQVSEFCAKLGQACGTKCRPIPQMLKRSCCSSPNRSKSPAALSNTWDTSWEDSQSQKPSLEDSLSDPSIKSPNHRSNNGSTRLIDDVSSPKKSPGIPFIDTSLAFPEENDVFRASQPDSLFPDFIDHNAQKDTSNKFGKENNTEAQGQGQHEVSVGSNNDVVVPSCKGKLLKCNEIWDRITSHPKYSDMDIDGLCQELMAKAKCSERGVVVQAEDLQCALDSR